MNKAPKKIWRLDCQVEIYYLEIPPQDQTLANSVGYIREDIVQEMLEQQRDALEIACDFLDQHWDMKSAPLHKVEEARVRLNATTNNLPIGTNIGSKGNRSR